MCRVASEQREAFRRERVGGRGVPSPLSLSLSLTSRHATGGLLQQARLHRVCDPPALAARLALRDAARRGGPQRNSSHAPGAAMAAERVSEGRVRVSWRLKWRLKCV